MYVGRFAPSPTGPLHAGSLLAAVAGWLCARHAGGRWLLRVEDIDPPREVAGAAADILATLQAFGLDHDGPVAYQSQHGQRYREALETLRRKDAVFPCWCSRSDLAPYGGLHRDGHCVRGPDPDRTPAWRLRVPDRVVGFDDLRMGRVEHNLRETVGDFVLRRADGFWAYQLACVVDDAASGVTDVVRGHDLLDSTPRQIHLQQVLGLPTPRYLHLPLLLDGDGRKLSKSEGDLAVDRRDPLPALALALHRLGLSPGPARSPRALLREALDRFDPARLPGHDLYGTAAGPGAHPANEMP